VIKPAALRKEIAQRHAKSGAPFTASVSSLAGTRCPVHSDNQIAYLSRTLAAHVYAVVCRGGTPINSSRFDTRRLIPFYIFDCVDDLDGHFRSFGGPAIAGGSPSVAHFSPQGTVKQVRQVTGAIFRGDGPASAIRRDTTRTVRNRLSGEGRGPMDR